MKFYEHFKSHLSILPDFEISYFIYEVLRVLDSSLYNFTRLQKGTIITRRIQTVQRAHGNKGFVNFRLYSWGRGLDVGKEVAGKEVKRRSAEKKHETVAQWVFGDSCQVNVLDLSKLRSEKRHSAGRIEVLYRYTAIYFSNGRLTRILVIVNKLFCREPIENC